MIRGRVVWTISPLVRSVLRASRNAPDRPTHRDIPPDAQLRLVLPPRSRLRSPIDRASTSGSPANSNGGQLAAHGRAAVHAAAWRRAKEGDRLRPQPAPRRNEPPSDSLVSGEGGTGCPAIARKMRRQRSEAKPPQPSQSSLRGSSRASTIQRTNRMASAPSMSRWS